VYEGTTPHSLGYVTIPLQPAIGTHVHIELTGAALDANPQSGTAEITGKIDPAAVTGNRNATLSIIEADLYK
jgi:hypothetical protein